MYIRFKRFDLFLEKEIFPFRLEFIVHPTEDGYVVLFGGKWRLTVSKF